MKYEPAITYTLDSGTEVQIYRFTNGRGARVQRDPISLSGRDELWELRVVHFPRNTGKLRADWEFDYTTQPLAMTFGCLNFFQVEGLLNWIFAMPYVGE